MAGLTIYLLGTFQVLRDGQAVTGFESDKVRALLAYLAIEGKRPLRRELLAGLFWPDMPESQARVNLRRALKNLRDAISDRLASPPFLCVSRSALQINPASSFWLDVNTFQQNVEASGDLTGREALQEAVTLYKGAFLAGFSLTGCTTFEEWQLILQEKLRRQAWEAHYALAKDEARHGRFPQALHHAQQQIALEPLQEVSHRQVIRYLTYTNQHNEALAHFQTWRDTLNTELNVAPDAKTRRLYEAIRDGKLRMPEETAVPHNLPPQPTLFVGRAAELDRLDMLIAAPDNRLITIHGVGGTGKTRLALAAAQRQFTLFIEHNGTLASRFPDGVYFVELAPLQTPDQIVPALAEALNFRLQSSGRDTRSMQQQLLAFLRQKHLLLVLDNFEHLLDGRTLLPDILQTAPNVQIIVTSRERLQLRWEQVFPVTGLNYPQAGFENTAVPLNKFAAIQLFQQTAVRVQPNFQLTRDKTNSLAALCQLVEGMPLALELAAAWVESHPVPTIVQLIQEGLEALQTDYEDVPARHRSMTAVFDASCQQLTPTIQQTLAQLSVFQGRFSARAAAAIAHAAPEQLKQLTRKSLLQPQDGRYQLHPLLQQYCAAKLGNDSAEETAVRHRHSAYFLNLLAEVRPSLIGPNQKESFTRIETNVENIQTAWAWAATQHDVARLNQAAESLGRFFLRYGRVQEGVATFGTAVNQLGKRPDCLATNRALLRCLTWLAACETDPEQARCHFDRGFALLSRRNSSELKEEKAHLLLRFGLHLSRTGRREDAKKLFAESHQLYQAVGDSWGTAAVLGSWGSTFFSTGDYQKGREMREEALNIFRSLRDLANIAYTLEALGEISTYQGDMPHAEQLMHEALVTHQAVGNMAGVVSASFELGVPLFWQGKFAEALALSQESLALAEKYGLESVLEFSLAVNNMHLANYQAACTFAEQGIARYQAKGDARNVALCLSITGWVAVAQGAYQQADTILQRSEAMYQEIEQRAEIGWVQFTRALAALGLNDRRQARQFVHDTLMTAQATRDFSIGVCSLAATAVLRAHEPNADNHKQAITLYAAASSYPWLTRSRWFYDVAGRHITAVAETLPPEQVAAAQAAGSRLELWPTVDSLLQQWTTLEDPSQQIIS